MKTLAITVGIALLAFAAYFFWPNKSVTRCGAISDGEGGTVTSCSTCICDRGIPSGLNSPECIGGSIISCSDSS